MNKNKKTYGLTALYIALIFLAGCFPEASLEWSDDGSIGVVKMGELMGVVDGETGQFRPIAHAGDQEGTQLNSISISADGKLVAYSLSQKIRNLKVNDVDEDYGKGYKQGGRLNQASKAISTEENKASGC